MIYSFNMLELLQELKEAFKPYQNPKKALEMKAYMKGQFAFLGVNAQDRKLVLKPLLKELKVVSPSEILTFCALLWEESEREYQHAAVDILNANAKKLPADSMAFIESLITEKSWWDTVDLIASNAVGILNLKYPKEIKPWIKSAIKSDNFWMNRTAIIHQLKYKDKLDTELLKDSITPHLANKEFFIQKAIGWALRQHSRVDSEWVQHFVKEHKITGLAKREALRLLLK